MILRISHNEHEGLVSGILFASAFVSFVTLVRGYFFSGAFF